MERDSEEVWASSYAGMFAYYREKVCSVHQILKISIKMDPGRKINNLFHQVHPKVPKMPNTAQRRNIRF